MQKFGETRQEVTHRKKKDLSITLDIPVSYPVHTRRPAFGRRTPAAVRSPNDPACPITSITMFPNIRKPVRPLTLVGNRSANALDAPGAGRERRPRNQRARDLDWSLLMAHAQAGDRAAYRRLLEDIAPYVRSIAARSHRDRCDVEDTLQDVLLTVHAVRHTYDPTRPFGPWLVAIVNRRIVDRLRRQRRMNAHETAMAEDDHETFAAPEANHDEATSAAQTLREAVGRLPPGQRQAVELLKLNELSLKEAAVVTGMSVAALKVASHRGVRRLRTLLASGNKRGHDT